MKVLLGPSSFAEIDRTPLDHLMKTGAQVIPNSFRRKLTKSELIEILADDVDGIIAGLEPLDHDVLTHSNLKVISRCGSGMSNVDQKTAKVLGIRVYSTPFGPTNAVAELTVGCLISLIRQVPAMNAAMHQGQWNKRIGTELRGKTVVIIGYGRIGQRTGKLLSAFGVELIFVDPQLVASVDVPAKMDLNQALPLADVIIIHAGGTEKIIGDREFEYIKEGAYLLNAARGEVIDEALLLSALKAEKIAGAWIDTYSVEPYSGPLCTMPNVVLTPHIGSYTQECRRNMEMEAVENLIRGFE